MGSAGAFYIGSWKKWDPGHPESAEVAGGRKGRVRIEVEGKKKRGINLI